MTYATINTTSTRTQDAVKTSFRQPLSATAIADMKSRIETNYKVAFLVSGVEYDYAVTLEGATGPFTRAMNTLFPKGREDILTQPPTMDGTHVG